MWPDVEWDFQLSSLQPTSHQTLLLSWPIAWPSCQIFLSLLIYLSDFTARGLMSRSDDFTIPTWILPLLIFNRFTANHHIRFQSVLLSKHKTLTQCWINVGPTSKTLGQNWSSIESTSCVCSVILADQITGSGNEINLWTSKFTNIWSQTRLNKYVWFSPTCSSTWSYVRCGDPQLQVGENYSYVFNLRPNICKFCYNTHFIPNNFNCQVNSPELLFIPVY